MVWVLPNNPVRHPSGFNRLFRSCPLYHTIARTEPPMVVSPDMREARGSQAQPSHSISQQHSQPESSVPSSEQYHLDPLIARQIGAPSEPAAAVRFVPVITYVPVPVGDPSSLPPYERNAPQGTMVSQEGTPSTSGTGVPSATRDEPNKLSGNRYLIFPSSPLNSWASCSVTHSITSASNTE